MAADEVVLEASGLAGVHEVGAPGYVDDGLGQRLIQRHVARAQDVLEDEVVVLPRDGVGVPVECVHHVVPGERDPWGRHPLGA